MSSAWYICYLPRPRAEIRLYCFPFAGGCSSTYRSWLSVLPDWIELRAVRLPGRQNRRHEPAYRSCRKLVGELVDALAGQLSEMPFAFFGHSMGALLSFELARVLRRLSAPQPALLGVSAFGPPHQGHSWVSVSGLPDETFLACMRALGGLPGEALTEPSLRGFFLPTLRADLTLVETYRYLPESPLNCPISVFGGSEDPVVLTEELQGWQKQSTRPVVVRVFPGHHFYLTEHSDAVVSSFAEDLRHVLLTSGCLMAGR